MTRANALAYVAVLTALAGGVTLAFGFHALMFVGAAGLFAALGGYITDPARRLDDPIHASHYDNTNNGTAVRWWVWRFTVVAYALAMIVLGVALSAPAKAYEERFEVTDCWFSIDQDRPARCGFLTVPERRDRPNGQELSLPVVILERSTTSLRRPPIVLLSGGPGQPTYLDSARDIDYWWEVAEAFPRGHDFILLDQRGIGDPWLGCMELEDPRVWGGLTEKPNTTKDHLNVWRQSVAECRDRLIQIGVDLSAYNSRESAGDIAALGRLLDPQGRQKLTLYGVSYGT